MKTQSKVFVEIAGEKFAVSRFLARTFYATGLIGINGTTSNTTFLIARGSASTQISVPVEVRHVGGTTEFVIAEQGGHLKSVTSFLRWSHGLEGFFSNLTPDALETPAPTGLQKYKYMSSALYGLAVAALFLLLIEQGSRRTAIDAEFAYVTVPGLALDVNTSGLVEYLKPGGSLRQGEFFAALRSSKGNPIFIEASKAGEIRDASQPRGAVVKRGQGLLVLVEGERIPYAAIFVKPSRAIAAIQGGLAKIKFADSGDVYETKLNAKNVVLREKRLITADGILLTEIDVPLPEKYESQIGQPLTVSFNSPTSGLHWIFFSENTETIPTKKIKPSVD